MMIILTMITGDAEGRGKLCQRGAVSVKGEL